MKILVMGGTQFVGRHFVEAAIARGHELTLFHRGKTGGELFPDLEHRYGNRLEDLSALQEGTWDATVDISAYVPRAVRMLADALQGRGGRYLQVSTISIYDPEAAAHPNEDSPKVTIPNPDTEQVTPETYGALKYLCELEAAKHFNSPTFVRPTIIIGPYDHTNRFHTWVRRIAAGEPVSLPERPEGTPPAPFQWVDGRDLAQFMVHLLESGTTGAYTCASDGMSFFEALQRSCAALRRPAEIGVAEPDADSAHFPLVLPNDGSRDAMFSMDNRRARAAGMEFRSIEDSVLSIAEEIRRE